MSIEPTTLAAVSELIERRMGLHFPAERYDVLARGLARGAVAMDLADPEAYADQLLTTDIAPEEWDALAQVLTVGETYFFREPQALKALEEHILPELIEARRKSGEKRIRMWSAGCCSGEEAYTLAIILSRMIPALSEWHITILGTDINPEVLRKARTGRYREWSFRGAPDWLKTDWFTANARGEYDIAASLRNRVTFSYLNLVEDTYPSLPTNTVGMDVILCRNVMMYFSPDRAQRVASGFHRALLDGGWLLVSPSECSSMTSALFSRVSFPGATLLRKNDGGSVEALRPEGARVVAVGATPWRAPVRKAVLPVLKADAGVDGAVIDTDHVSVAPRPTTPPLTLVSPTPAETLLAAATAAYAQADYAAVLASIEALPDPGLPALVLAARACADLGRLEDALAWCRKALERDKLQPSVYYLQATVHMAACDESAALASLQRVLYLDPHSVLAHFTTANILLRVGETTRAMKSFRRTMDLLTPEDDATELADSDGMTVGRLRDIVRHLQVSLTTLPGPTARRAV